MSRKVDDLGRIVIPAEIRKAFGIREGDHLDIAVDGETILLRKCEDSCVFCNASADLKEFRGRLVCAGCVRDMSGEPEVPDWDPFSEM